MGNAYQDTVAPAWFSPLDLQDRAEPTRINSAFIRLWGGFMTARVMIALALLVLQATISILGQVALSWLIGLCVAYLAQTLWVRMTWAPHWQGRSRHMRWIPTIGVDVLAFSILQFPQVGGINYTPLYALPVLLAAVLGSRTLALSTASGVTLLLLISASGSTWLSSAENPFALVQAALTGVGLLIVAWQANELASRLAGEEKTARKNQIEAHAHKLVNDLVIENLTDGLLVIDTLGVVRAANPAARQLLGGDEPAPQPPFTIHAEPAWEPLARLAHRTYEGGKGLSLDVLIRHPGHASRHAQARTRLTPDLPDGVPALCVVFLQDLREMEARLRTEKLASMGRMSAAVAHEIRNPLAAISQANALLEEEINDPHQRQLTTMVSQNVRRLAQIVDEVLEVARVPSAAESAHPVQIFLDPLVDTACQDWARQCNCAPVLQLSLGAQACAVYFSPEHLRRILVNLLDNALRHASGQPGAIKVTTQLTSHGQAILTVWSDGTPIEVAVQRHLFEPFFSSQSRSSGLGLFICRQLCETHGATIGHEGANRRRSVRGAEPSDGNEFFVKFRMPQPSSPAPAVPA